MKRIHLFEFEDQPWFPDVIRKGMLDYLSYFFSVTKLYRPSVPLIEECLETSTYRQVLDLCSGGGGPMLQIEKYMQEEGSESVQIFLSDKYPNIPAFKLIAAKSGGRISYIQSPVDATAVPGHLKGVRTIFSAFHHFRPKQAKMILEDAVKQNSPIAIFDGGDKNIFIMLGILILHPVLLFVFTPFIRPFRLGRLLFTYMVPLIPLCTVWDGVISIFRLYSPADMHKMASEAGPTYTWKAGKLRHPSGLGMAFLTGYPTTGPNKKKAHPTRMSPT